MGKFGYGEENERGEKLLNFCLNNNLVIANTMTYKRKAKHQWTWESPDGVTKNQIDYVLVNKKWRTSITSCRAFPGADIGSDHQLLLAGVRIKLKRQRMQKKVKRFNISKQKDNLIKDQFEVTVGGRFNVLLEQQQSIEEMWKNTKEILCEAAEEVLGFKESEARKPWISQEVLDLSDRRKWLKKEKANGDRQIQLAYNKLTKEIHQKARQCIEEWLRNQCIEIQQASQEHATSKVYQKIKLISGEVTCKSLPVADKDGKLLQEKEAIKERWKEHF